MREIKKCSDCGAPMALRKPGPNQSWNPFWGCTKYPKCKGTEKAKDIISKLKNVKFIDKKDSKVDLGVVDLVRKRRKIFSKKNNPYYESYLNMDYTPENFPYVSFPYDKFNPLQDLFLPYVHKDVNVIVCASTSAGKTSLAEMVIGRTAHEKSKSIYLSPLRALSQQKFDRWREKTHEFSNYRISLQTGDVLMDNSAKSFLSSADIIIQTSEMLHHKSIHIGDTNSYLLSVGVVVVDEAHLLDEESRGSELECGLEKFTRINPHARLIFLSATMENVEDLSAWLTTLNKKETVVVKTNYRPCELEVHVEPVKHHKGDYGRSERELVNKALDIVNSYPDDKFILFVHSKKTGYKLLDALTDESIESAFHSRDLPRAERNAAENAFLDGSLNVLVATSTLAMGLDYPARRTVILGTKRGHEPVKASELAQEMGRAGRPSFDKKGDAYLLIHDNCIEEEKIRIFKPFFVKSSLSNIDNLTFHILFAIYDGVKTEQDIYKWYSRTLSYQQNNEITAETLDSIIKNLVMMGMIKAEEETGDFRIMSLGKICCWFYINPKDVYGWKKALVKIVSLKAHNNPMALIWALTSAYSYTGDISNQMQKQECNNIGAKSKIPKKLLENLTDGQNKHLNTLYCIINDFKVPKALLSVASQWKGDIERTISAVKTIDQMVGRWEIADQLNKIGIAISKGVTYEQAELVTLSGIGKKRADKLIEHGIFTIRDILINKNKIKSILGPKTYIKVISDAKSRISRKEK